MISNYIILTIIIIGFIIIYFKKSDKKSQPSNDLLLQLHENIRKLNGTIAENPLVKNVVNFINKDKKRSICTPFS